MATSACNTRCSGARWGTATVLVGQRPALQALRPAPQWLVRPLLWVSITISLLDQLGAFLAVSRYAREHPHLEQLNAELEKHSDQLRTRLSSWVERRVQKAYPAAARGTPTVTAQKTLSFADLLWLFVIGAFLGDIVETLFCRDDGGRLDEPFQPGLGSVQRGVGAGTGPLYCSAAEQ